MTNAGAWNYTAAAKEFAGRWVRETEYHTDQSKAIQTLRDFDKWLLPAQKVHPVFLYANHDNYMGTLFGLPAQFKDAGLVAQHGHQADDFNSDEKAKTGYLLTQAAFAILAVRIIEDPMSALVAGIKGGIGPRLTVTEMALEEAVFKPILAGKKPAMTFVMGHTHEPALQEIHVVELAEDKSRATGTSTGTSTGTGVGTGTSTGTGSSTATGTSTGQSRNTSTKTR